MFIFGKIWIRQKYIETLVSNPPITSNSSLIVFSVNCWPELISVTQWAAVSICLLLTIAPPHHTLCLWKTFGPFNIRAVHGC